MIQWLDLCIYKTKLIYTAKRKKEKKEKSLNVSIPQLCFNGRCNVAILFAYYSLFYPKFRKKHTNIIYIERVALHEKNLIIDYSNSLSENCLKLVMLKQSWKSSKYQIKNRKVNCYSSSTGLKQWSCIKGNFTVNAMEVCQKIIVHTCSF